MEYPQVATRLVFLIAVIIFAPLKLSADDFPSFRVHLTSNIHASGYVENLGGADTRIRVLPVLVCSGIDFPDSGDIILHYTVSQFPANLSDRLRKEVRKAIPTAGSDSMVDALPPNNLSISLLVGGKKVSISDSSSRVIGGRLTGSLKVKNSDSLSISTIFEAGATLEAKYAAKIGDVSSLTVRLNVQQISSSSVEAFRNYVARQSSESGGFLFWKWQREMLKESIKVDSESVDESQGSKELKIIRRDPTPEMEKRLNEYLGIVKSDFDTVSKNHTAAAEAARQKSRKDLAALHNKYASAVSNNTAEAKIDVMKSLAGLAAGDIVAFLANGIAFDSSKASIDQDCYIISANVTKTKFSSEVEEFLIRSAVVEFVTTATVSKDAFLLMARQKIGEKQGGVVGPITDEMMKNFALTTFGDVQLWRYAIRKRLIAADEVILEKSLKEWAEVYKNKPCIEYLESIGQ